MPKETLYQSIGWLGAALVLSAYMLTTLGWLAATSVTAAVLNIAGGAGVAAVSWSRRNYQPLVVNLVWTVIALVSLLRPVFRG